MTAEGRHALRPAEALPRLQAMHDWNDANQALLRPSSYLADAVNCAQAQRHFIDRCFTDGRFELDNVKVREGDLKAGFGQEKFYVLGLR